jgi:uncharacterized protein (TIGR02453 family)
MEQGVFFIYFGLDRCFAGLAWWQPSKELLQAMRQAIATRPDEFRTMVRALTRNGLALDGEGALKRMPAEFKDVADADLAEAIRNRHFVVRHEIDPEGIHEPALVDELVGFALQARPLLDWGRGIERSSSSMERYREN